MNIGGHLTLLLCLLLTLGLSCIGRATGVVTKCAYVHHDVVKEMASKSMDQDGGSDGDQSSDNISKSSSGLTSPTSKTGSSSSSTALQGEVLPDNRTMQCTKASDFCYALWKESPNNKSTITILAQGCWESSGEYDCRRETECVADNRPMKAMNNTKFCCCSGDLCNDNLTDSDVPLASEEPFTIQPDPTYQHTNHNADTLIVTLLSALLVATGMIAAFLSYRRWTNHRKPSPDSVHLMESAVSTQSPALDLENLKLVEMVGRGRYGTVWRGTLNDHEVAVKVFVHQHRQYFLNEKDIYSLHFMDHPSLMKFIGGEQKQKCSPIMATMDVSSPRPEYYLVMGYAPFGCLQDYLRNYVVDWPTLCCMTQGVANGLAHLHTDLRRGDKVKPCISHRDVNSRNVLVKADLSCALCDMGFAMKIAGSKYYSHNGEEQHAETTSLTDVGTLRYMAPEVLEGAVNLRDCESSLKQIDVYALGLVTWEVATRCSDLYQGLDVPDYKLPFEVEIGLHPTFEQMQVLVSRNKARPLFPEVWKDTNLAVRLLKETIEDCWDQDAEARLTSLCVEERLMELPILWERHKANIGISSVSPTVNPTFPLSTSRHTDTSSGGELTDRNANIMGVVSLADTAHAASFLGSRAVNGGMNYQRIDAGVNRESSVSENTVETTVTLSPAEPIEVADVVQQPPQSKNCMINQVFPWLPQSLQPHQGRNPCLERNMIMEPLEEVSVSGNTLLGKGYNQKSLLLINRDSSINGSGDMGDLFDALHLSDNMESNSLVNHDVLSQSNRAYHPIPYLQNPVHNTNPTIHCPKQPNIPGNGQHPSHRQLPPSSNTKLPTQKRGTFAARFERKKEVQCSAGTSAGGKLNKKERSGIRSLLDWSRLTRNAGNSGDESINDKISTNEPNLNLGRSGSSGVASQRAMSDSTLNTEKSNLAIERGHHKDVQPTENHMIQTEVYLSNENAARSRDTSRKPIVRPASGNIPGGVSSHRSAEFSMNKLHLQNGQTSVIKMRSESQTDLNSIPTTSFIDDQGKMRRPNTLNINGNNFHQSLDSSSDSLAAVSSDVNLNGYLTDDKSQMKFNELKHGTKQKIETRVKTPFALKPGRFSLHDDRMMSSWPTDSLDTKNPRPKHCLSVPNDINYLCIAVGPNAVSTLSSAHSSAVQQRCSDDKISVISDHHVHPSLSLNHFEIPSTKNGATTKNASTKVAPLSISEQPAATSLTTGSTYNQCERNSRIPVVPPPAGEPYHVSCM